MLQSCSYLRVSDVCPSSRMNNNLGIISLYLQNLDTLGEPSKKKNVQILGHWSKYGGEGCEKS